MPAAFQLPACDFGLMVPGAVSFKTMEVSNDGSAPIVFGDPKSSCACLEVRLDSHRVEPGQVVKVHLKLEERKPVGEVIYQFWIPQEAGGVVSGVGLF